jgi:hypothetical protein
MRGRDCAGKRGRSRSRQSGKPILESICGDSRFLRNNIGAKEFDRQVKILISLSNSPPFISNRADCEWAMDSVRRGVFT